MRVLTRVGILSSALLLIPALARAEKFVVAWAAVSALNSPFWVMNDAGFLKQEGLDIDFVYIASSPTVARATLAGDLAISASNGQVIVDAGLNGADLIAIGAVTNVVAFYVMAHPEIKNVPDLKGKAVGVTRFGAATDFGMRILLNKYGLEGGTQNDCQSRQGGNPLHALGLSDDKKIHQGTSPASKEFSASLRQVDSIHVHAQGGNARYLCPLY